MFFAGIDPSITNTGVTVLDDTGSVVATYNSKVVKCTATVNKEISRYNAISEGITNFLQPYSTNLFMAYENYSFGSTHRAFSLAEFGGILKLHLANSCTGEINLIPPTTVKKFATGSGTASKEEMVAQAMEESVYIKQLSKAARTSDVCDSYFLAKCAWYMAGDTVAHHETNKNLLRMRLEMVKSWQKQQQ